MNSNQKALNNPAVKTVLDFDMKIQRVTYTNHGTFGVFIDNTGIPFAVTLELPWRQNQEDVSCIPMGHYEVKRIPVQDGVVFKVLKVPGRSGVDMHVANTLDELLGCIGIGESFEPINNKPGIYASKKGFGDLIRKTSGMKSFDLLISGDIEKERI